MIAADPTSIQPKLTGLPDPENGGVEWTNDVTLPNCHVDPEPLQARMAQDIGLVIPLTSNLALESR